MVGRWNFGAKKPQTSCAMILGGEWWWFQRHWFISIGFQPKPSLWSHLGLNGGSSREYSGRNVSQSASGGTIVYLPTWKAIFLPFTTTTMPVPWMVRVCVVIYHGETLAKLPGDDLTTMARRGDNDPRCKQFVRFFVFSVPSRGGWDDF